MRSAVRPADLPSNFPTLQSLMLQPAALLLVDNVSAAHLQELPAVACRQEHQQAGHESVKASHVA
jgi:hypothetical protein